MDSENYDYDSTPPSNPAQPTVHTQFLDLTNGVGGEGINNDADAMMYDDVDADYRDLAATPPPMDHETGAASGGPGAMAQGNAASGEGSLKFDPSTPGRVVETGQEHTGRWTKEEHEAFLSALKMYGKEWKKVAAKVKTRTVVQTRTHAQKYFQKLAKASGGTEDAAQIEMRVASEAKKYSASLQKKKQRVTPPKVSRTASVASAAQVISSLHNAQQPMGGSTASHGFQAGVATHGSNSSSPEQPSAFISSHGFSSAFAEPMPAFATSFSKIRHWKQRFSYENCRSGARFGYQTGQVSRTIASSLWKEEIGRNCRSEDASRCSCIGKSATASA
jgi:SHAQKYF class myb-like DNA-binding protein